MTGTLPAGIALSDAELSTIAGRLGREPSLVEVHAFNAQWSEHCSYKSSRHHLKRLPVDGPTVLQGPAEDAGIVHFGEWKGVRYGIVIAHESHNHPSQVVPFEGAATGIGGIVRDVLCMGATVIAIADPLRFGRVEHDGHPRYVAGGVVDGIGSYGNAIGVPTIAGDVYFDDAFDENVLVNVVSLGLVRADGVIHSAAPAGSAGWDIVLVGKATDRSGFGGAAFSSLDLDAAGDDANRGAVQVPDPFLKNVVMRASYRVFEMLRDERRTVGFKDLGAGGIMGCTAELVSSGGFGAEIDLDRAPLADPALPAAVIAVGETQERLAWVLPPDLTPRVLAIYNEEYGLPDIAAHAGAAVIGRVTEAQDYVLRHHGEEVMRVPVDFLTGSIRYERAIGECAKSPPPQPAQPLAAPAGEILRKVLAHRDVCSRRAIYERYDSVVRGATSIAAGFADAGVVCPIPGAPLAVALSVDGNPRYGKIDPRVAAQLAVVESHRNVVSVGARPAGMTDCLNFGNPERPDQFAEFDAALSGLAEAARALETPFVSGNVSLYNAATTGRAIPASPIVACVGVIDDISLTATPLLKVPGSPLFFIGARQSALGGSVYADVCGQTGGALPAADLAGTKREIAFMLAAYRAGHVLAAHDISDGGLLVTVAEMCFTPGGPGKYGAEISLDAELPAERSGSSAQAGAAGTWFGEAGGFVVEVPAQGASRFADIAREYGVTAVALGKVTGVPELRVASESLALDELFAAWDSPLEAIFR